ncbi:hypothetical protein [Nitratireductor rhodophyticola]|uniref:hypothetical protein n=1 Tax=Nitratireductor rhodophyticola TaxID=2854036 RepID=UPI002AC34AE0|nr:hypothetical protein [Nitratireductor rhodophyticola]
MSSSILKLVLLAAFIAAGCGTSVAQSMTPMRGKISSFGDTFTVRVFPYNPYPHKIRMAVKAYDQDFRPIEAHVFPSETMVGSRTSRSVLVSVGFNNKKVRRVRICAESIPFPGRGTNIKAQVCGRFIAYRID